MIHCTHIGCKLEFNINKINDHELLKCPYRIIKCPAKVCDYKGKSNQVHNHVQQCPYIQVYCGTCYGAFGVEVIEHSCAMILKRRLVESVRFPLAWVPEVKGHYTGDVILVQHVTHDPFDLAILTEVKADTTRPAMLSSGQGLTELAPQLRVLQRQHGNIPSQNDHSQFNFS